MLLNPIHHLQFDFILCETSWLYYFIVESKIFTNGTNYRLRIEPYAGGTVEAQFFHSRSERNDGDGGPSL